METTTEEPGILAISAVRTNGGSTRSRNAEDETEQPSANDPLSAASQRAAVSKALHALARRIVEDAQIVGYSDPALFLEMAKAIELKARDIREQQNNRVNKYTPEADTRTEDEVRRDRERILGSARAPHPIPPGKTLEDILIGALSDEKSDEEISVALAELA